MKLRLRLSDVDVKRFDVDEPPVLDLDTVSFREVVAMQRGLDVEGETVAFDSAQHWRVALFGRPVLGEDGNPVMVDLLDDDGKPVLDDDGKPVRLPRRLTDWGAVLVGVWLALRRAGKTMPLADVADCDAERARFELVDDDADLDREPGKDESVHETTS
jgi:hypothetical protein